MRTTPPDVEFDDITTILGSTPILHRLALHVPAGRVTVLMGPSGVGKTTLIKNLLGLLEPDAGEIRIGGEDLWDADEERRREVRGNVGAMLGGSTLYATSVFSSMTVLENLTYSLRMVGVPEEQRRPRALARLEELHLLDVADWLPERLPAHAAKRLALARALVIDAPLTVLDEIDVGLDTVHTQAMLAAVAALRDRTGCTMLVTTHNLEVARMLADKLAILVKGQIVAQGPPTVVLDGIHDTGDFDRRFEFSDMSGAPKLADARAVLDEDSTRVAGTTAKGKLTERDLGYSVDPKQVGFAVAALVVLAVVFLLVLVFV